MFMFFHSWPNFVDVLFFLNTFFFFCISGWSLDLLVVLFISITLPNYQPGYFEATENRISKHGLNNRLSASHKRSRATVVPYQALLELKAQTLSLGLGDLPSSLY